MITPDADAADASSCSDDTVPVQLNNETMRADNPTLTPRSSSPSSLGGVLESTPKVAGDEPSDGCQDRLDSPELKNRLVLAVASESWLAEVEGECRVDVVEKSNDNNYDRKITRNGSDGSDVECTRFKDPFPSPTHSRASTPLSALTTPINSTSIKNQISWCDPFPTPDVSVLSRCGTPLSFRVAGDNDDIDGDKYGSILNADFATIFRVIPKIPLIEECTIGTMDDDICRKNDAVNTSCSRFQSLNVPELSHRKVSSESNFPMISIPIPSVEDIWSALNAGPDGHDLDHLETECIDNVIVEEKRRIERRNSEMVLRGKKIREYYHDSTQDKPIRRRLDKELVVPADKSREGIRHRPRYLSSPANPNTILNAAGPEPDSAKEVKIQDGRPRGGAPQDAAMSAKRLAFRALKRKSSRAVANAAGELIMTPVRSVVQRSSRSAVKLVQNTRQKLRERRERRRQRRLARMNDPPRSWWICIPADHPCKVAWDVLTMIWAALGAYRTHVRIRDRVFDQSPLILLTEVWFAVDILLNFITEHKTRQGEVIRDGKAVWARYLTTWFVIDILSLVPWESIYVQPIVEKIKRRNIFQKTFFRSKAAVRVSRVLRGRHIKLFGRVSKRSGISLHRLVALVIKYLPKYLLFLRNMKGAMLVRALRLVHWLHNMHKKIWVKARNARQIMAARRAFDDDDDDDDDDVDEDGEDIEEEESDEESESDDEGKEEGDTLLMDDEPSFQRAHSENSPLLPRRQSFSDGDICLED